MAMPETVLVEVKLFSVFRSGRFASKKVRLTAPSTASDLLAKLEIPEEDVGVLMINGRDGTLRQRLADGDRVTLIPSIGGG